jgi:hypothetical protein
MEITKPGADGKLGPVLGYVHRYVHRYVVIYVIPLSVSILLVNYL